MGCLHHHGKRGTRGRAKGNGAAIREWRQRRQSAVLSHHRGRRSLCASLESTAVRRPPPPLPRRQRPLAAGTRAKVKQLRPARVESPLTWQRGCTMVHGCPLRLMGLGATLARTALPVISRARNRSGRRGKKGLTVRQGAWKRSTILDPAGRRRKEGVSLYAFKKTRELDLQRKHRRHLLSASSCMPDGLGPAFCARPKPASRSHHRTAAARRLIWALADGSVPDAACNEPN